MDKVDVKTSVERRLRSFGYNVLPSDDWTIDFIIDKVENYIKSNCNLYNIPNELLYIETDMICGEFLNFKNNSGNLDIDNIDFSMVNKSIQEGDVKIEFYVDGIKTGEQKLESLINALISNSKNNLSSYRCIKW